MGCCSSVPAEPHPQDPRQLAPPGGAPGRSRWALLLHDGGPPCPADSLRLSPPPLPPPPAACPSRVFTALPLPPCCCVPRQARPGCRRWEHWSRGQVSSSAMEEPQPAGARCDAVAAGRPPPVFSQHGQRQRGRQRLGSVQLAAGRGGARGGCAWTDLPWRLWRSRRSCTRCLAPCTAATDRWSPGSARRLTDPPLPASSAGRRRHREPRAGVAAGRGAQHHAEPGRLPVHAAAPAAGLAVWHRRRAAAGARQVRWQPAAGLAAGGVCCCAVVLAVPLRDRGTAAACPLPRAAGLQPTAHRMCRTPSPARPLCRDSGRLAVCRVSGVTFVNQYMVIKYLGR